MAKIYVKNTDGTYTTQPSTLVSNLDIVQDKGNSLTSAMSQKAVTDELATKQNVLTDTDGGYGQRVAKLEKEGIASQEKLSELEGAINGQSPKLFIHAGQRYKTDGTIKADANGATTDVLPLSIFGNYQENGIKVTQGQFRMYSSGDYCLAVFFDASKSFVGYVQTRQTISTLAPFPSSQIPSDAVFVAFSGRTNVSSDDVYNVEFAINGNGLAKDVEKINEDVASVNSKLDTMQESLGDVSELVHSSIEVIKGRNNFNKATPYEAGFVTSSGAIITEGSYSRYITSDYYPLLAGTYTIYTTETDNLQRLPVCIFNANKEMVGYIYSGSVMSETFTLENDGYIRFSCGGNAYYNKIMIVEGTTIYPYEEYLVVNKIKDDVIVPQVKEGNVLYKKKYIACGDSYTAWSDAIYLEGEYAGKTVNYAREILQRNHMSSDFSINFAESGSTIALSKEGTSSVNAKAFGNTKYLNIPSDTDYLTIAFGINDTALCNLGQLGDTDATTFYGAWNMVLNYYATNHPSMKIGIIIFQRNNNDFYAAVKEIAKYHGIPYLDFYGGEDTPIYVDGKAYPVDATIKATRHDYFCGHNAGADPNETFQDVKVVVNAAGSNPTHPGHRAHIDEAKIIEAFLRRL